ncbi:MAG: histidinol-phosphate transaminase [Oligoflexia bacterium]|nr:histidinol-phosphate transaminase [Oligoflexia bacterium]
MPTEIIQSQVPEYIRKLVPYSPGKPIEETQREFKLKRVIKLASNENPLGPSPKAIAAITRSIKETYRYPDASGYWLKKALATHLDVEARSLVLGNGSDEVGDLLVRAYCVLGDFIVTSQAAFSAYRIRAQVQGVKTLESPLTSDLRFDLDAMLKLVRENERVRMVFIPNPNNPTGTYVTEKELGRFLESLSKIRGGAVLAVLDYAYWEYVSASDLPDPLPFFRKYPNVVIMRTFSKVYGLAGLRVGYGIATPELVGNLDKIRTPFNMNIPALVGAVAALSDRAFVKKSVASNRRGMKFWEESLEAMDVPYWPSQGNFLLIDAKRGFGKPGSAVYQACLERGVIFRPVDAYGLGHALRISVGTDQENREAVRVLRDLFVKSIEGR